MEGQMSPDRRKASSSGASKCSICEVTFRRPEHLKRHLRSHTKEKPFQCSQCDRRFSRSDTLYRHDQSHHAPGVQGRSDRVHRITVKTFRACRQCALARVRCSGDEPCHRCSTRAIDCQYPTERRSKLKHATDQNQKSASMEAKTSSGSKEPAELQLPQDSPNEQGSVNPQSPPLQAKPQQFHFRFITYESNSPIDIESPKTPPSRNDTQLNYQSTTSCTAEPQNQPAYEHGPYSTDSLYHSNSPQANSQENAVIFPTTTPNTIATEECLDRSQAPSNVLPLEICQPSDLEMPLDPELFQPLSDLGMNWLPIDISKDFSSLQTMNSSFSYGTANEWWLETLNAKNDLIEPATNVDQVPLLGLTEASPSLPFVAMQSPQSQSSFSQDGSLFSDGALSCGDYYVDGEGARHTKQKRRRNTCWGDPISSLNNGALRNTSRSRLAFPIIPESLHQELCLNVSTLGCISSSTYETILNMFDKICSAGSPLFVSFETTQFPEAQLISYFLRHYFDEFQPVYPIFHMPTFDLDETHWTLILAMAAIGSCLVNSPETARYAYPLHEFARRAILIEKEKYTPETVPICLIQAMLLNCIGLVYCGDGQARSLGLSSLSDIVRFAHQQKLLTKSESNSSYSWKQWVDIETMRRTGYFIWLLDSTLVYTETNFRPLFTLKDAQAPIPSHESLWNANSEEVFKTLYQGDNVSLYSATEVLFIEKRLVSDISEFGQTLLLHAIYQRLWEVKDYFQSPLTCWSPNARRQPREAAIPSSHAVWLPGVPVYSKWRNSACDCLDTLHWFANGTIAKNAGLEHSTVLHLHTARIVLLVPFQEVRSLATLIADAAITWDNGHGLKKSHDWQQAWRWVKHDQYKARLAMIHAGSVLWYVRRYSTNAFHEPVAVFIATLALWAYGMCACIPCEKMPQPVEVELERSDCSQHKPPSVDICDSTPNPTFIHLDRPCDDEIVQLFVREGQTMKGNVTGVGDICSSQGPQRVLKEGIRILSSLASTWGITHEYIDILSRLGDRMSKIQH